MAYQALARKWRPRQFREIVGQEHVVRALTHGLESGRIHHAYLFTGTRGVGKTTVARLLAKAMNCDSLQGAEPCGECLLCRELDEGRFVDLIEVDAASRTRVEDTRDLLENVLYAPAQGRFKIYLIDEVHMLSNSSFNALLKTLEEPPSHVKFLLATTDPQKLPPTVLSRCLQFNLKHLAQEQIRGQMTEILKCENIQSDLNALKLLARAAEGSLRDGLSLLDQAIVYCGGTLTEDSVAAMLGTVARQPVFELLQALTERDAGRLMGLVEEMDERSPSYPDILQQLLIILHHTALSQWVPNSIRSDDDAEQILDLAQRISAEDLQLFYQIGLIGQRDLPLAPDVRIGFEMVLLRMLAFQPITGIHQPPPTRNHDKPVGPGTKPQILAAPNPDPIPQPADTRWSQAEAESSPVAKSSALAESRLAPAEINKTLTAESPAIGSHKDWPSLIRAMALSAMTRELANNTSLLSLDENVCVLSLEPRLAHLCSPRSEAALEKALSGYFNRSVKLQIRMEAPVNETPASQMEREKDELQRAAVDEIEQDEGVRALQAAFNARIVPGSIKPKPVN